MAVAASLYSLQATTNDNLVLKALRSNYLPFSAAILQEYFTGAQNRVPCQEFHEQLRAEIDVLDRSQDFEDFNLRERTPSEWCRWWINEAKLLARIQDEASHQEFYQLTSTGQAVLAFLASLGNQRQVLTSSRLTLLLNGFSELERKTNPDQRYRLKALRQQKAAIEEEIKRTKAGDIEVLDKDLALADLNEYVELARQVPQDFARVRESFRTIGQNLREELINSNLPQEEVLGRVFTNLNRIEETDEGKSFTGFFDLLMDQGLQSKFTAAIDGLMSRGLLDELNISDRRMILNFIMTLISEARPVQDMMSTIGQNLNEFVRSREFEEFRAMSELLNEIQRIGLKLVDDLKYRDGILKLEGTTAKLGSIGQLALSEPVDTRIEGVLEATEMEESSLEDLLEVTRKSEIDFESLRNNVNDCVKSYGQASIADVLTEHPADQGVASVVGLLYLAQRYAKEIPGEKEFVTWKAMFDEVERGAEVSRYLFESELHHD